VCGVIGLVYEHSRNDLGIVAGELLRTLEYRGYDSTGAAIQGDDEAVDLKKGVGAPSRMVSELGIDRGRGRILCAQVRWATFGAVDRANAQPHVVRCRPHGSPKLDRRFFLYGAHNGNVTNCDALKGWLTGAGHAVQSDNDGEMLVHTVEHFFAERLARVPEAEQRAPELRIRAMREAIRLAGARLVGSYAAVIVDPVTRTLWAIKKGSSLYFGVGEGGPGGRFAIASSDLSSVLKLTEKLVPMAEGEVAEFDSTRHRIMKLSDGTVSERAPVASRLRVQDTVLKPPFTTFMEQEIHAQIETNRDAIANFSDRASSAEADELHHAIDRFTEAVDRTIARHGRVFIVCCGSSFHAAKTAALFFNELADVETIPLLPGEFRGQYGRNVRDGDLFVAVSQSGETKDLIDVINPLIATHKDVRRVALVNNLNSTLAQEKSDIVIPLACGPEIAVAATKSFISQLSILYGLALSVAERRKGKEALAARRAQLAEMPTLIERTLAETNAALDEAAHLLYLRPSIHILATRLMGVAKEGALKIREVVLNHAEGFEASEFKHGPNTVLGFSTLYGMEEVTRVIAAAEDVVLRKLEEPAAVADLEAAKRATRDAIASLRGKTLKDALRTDYPLIYVTGPDPRDVDLTVSQINTHKIRGAMTIIVAEENEALRAAASKPPADNPNYRHVYVRLPATGDTLMTAFSATVALQRLALKMSLLKMAHLDSLAIADHGVHPDVPKNVSKSITVD
jgi:glucosamine 6-phosphate synthetase-like amidotransferase/phosphosugar isomerase protein